MAAPIAAIAGALGSLGSGGSNETSASNPYNGGLLTRIGGTGSDPLNLINVISQIVQGRRGREEKERLFKEGKRQFDVSTALDKDKLALDRQQAMAQQRQLGMAGIDRLADARSTATKNARTMSFAKDLASASRMR